MRAVSSIKEGPHVEYLIDVHGNVTIRVRGFHGDAAHKAVDAASKQLGQVIKSGPVVHDEIKTEEKGRARV
jgi:hypothetical protein